MSKNVKLILAIAPALIIYTLLAYYLRFTQDDAYISYRYVANFLNGHGLVYNIGERIEGFTNFGWVTYLILWGGVGLNYLLLSKLTCFLCGAGMVAVTFLIGRQVFGEKQEVAAVVSTYLVAANLSLAYWSPAGLETAAFGFVALLAVYWYLKRSWLLITAMLLAVWIRPEGAVVTGVLIVTEWIVERRIPVFTLRCAATAFLFSLPYVGFKLIYYGSIIPNPFYAKTGLNAGHLQSGLQYVWEYLRDYVLFGVGLVVPLLFLKKLSAGLRAILVFSAGYLIYVILVGGDVLKVHRFFVPVMGLTSILLVTTLKLFTDRLRQTARTTWLGLLAAVLLLLCLYLPYDTVKAFNYNERLFTAKMAGKAKAMADSDKSNFSVALPTIGIFGFNLLGHEIIDMVGLTDSTIAKHSEAVIPGMESTWKEKKHNSRYLLERAPDYIVFSTGVKPSAPAEKALMMYGAFQRAYRAVTWYYRRDSLDTKGSLNIAYKKMRPVVGPIVPDYPAQYVEDFVRGSEAYSAMNPRAAIGYFENAISITPDKPQDIELLHLLGLCYGAAQGNLRGVETLNRAVAQDSLAFGPHRELYVYEMLTGNREKGLIHRAYLERLVPWYLPRIDSVVASRLRQQEGTPTREDETPLE